jgi:hypothetical protein
MDSTIFHKASDGWYMCGCGFHTPTIDTSHTSTELRGYCNYGMKAIEDHKYQCICGKILDDSILGKRHAHTGECANKAIEYQRYTCKLCDVECHDAHRLKKHQQTTRHKNKINDPLFCITCDIRCLSKALMEAHIKTKKHTRLLEEPNLPLHCEICNITCPSQKTIRAHLQTKKHMKNLT